MFSVCRNQKDVSEFSDVTLASEDDNDNSDLNECDQEAQLHNTALPCSIVRLPRTTCTVNLLNLLPPNIQYYYYHAYNYYV